MVSAILRLILAIMAFCVLLGTCVPVMPAEIPSALADIMIMPEEFTNSSINLEKRQCKWNTQTKKWNCDYLLPSLKENISRMRDIPNGGKATTTSVPFFYTGLFDGTQAGMVQSIGWCTEWLEANGITDLYSTFQAANSDWRQTQLGWVLNNLPKFAQNYGAPESLIRTEFGGCYNQALSFAIQKPDAEVYVCTKHGVDWKADSVWNRAEYWPLTRDGGPVKKIFRVDPRPAAGGTCAKAELIWQRGVNAARPPLFKCQIPDP